MEGHLEEHRKWLDELFNTGIYSDLKLVSTETTYAAHRAVVCYQSPVIQKHCTSHATNWIQPKFGGYSKDTATTYGYSFIYDDPQCVDCMVQYFYRWDYEIRRPIPDIKAKPGLMYKEDADKSLEDNIVPVDSDLVVHVKVFALAEKYGIPPLKALSVAKFEAAAQQHWKSHYLVDAAREACRSTVPDDVREMRDAIVRTLHERRELLHEDSVKQLLLDLPQLSLDLLMHNMNKSTMQLGLIGFKK